MALEQLSTTLEHHQHVFKVTQDQLKGTKEISCDIAQSETGALSIFTSERVKEDEQFKRLVGKVGCQWTCAIESWVFLTGAQQDCWV